VRCGQRRRFRIQRPPSFVGVLPSIRGSSRRMIHNLCAHLQSCPECSEFPPAKSAAPRAPQNMFRANRHIIFNSAGAISALISCAAARTTARDASTIIRTMHSMNPRSSGVTSSGVELPYQIKDRIRFRKILRCPDVKFDVPPSQLVASAHRPQRRPAPLNRARLKTYESLQSCGTR